MTITQKDIEAILGEYVGEFPKVFGFDIIVSEDKNIDSDAYKFGYNKALADIRNRIPETARKVLERVGDWLADIDTTNTDEYMFMERILASLAGEDEGDNGEKL